MKMIISKIFSKIQKLSTKKKKKKRKKMIKKLKKMMKNKKKMKRISAKIIKISYPTMNNSIIITPTSILRIFKNLSLTSITIKPSNFHHLTIPYPILKNHQETI